ncbi:MAG: hypothetical protein K2H86_03070, partial [Muribaculaceae bacterium]|nr:hypothetical protein [Muribaculaceae bacterium]
MKSKLTISAGWIVACIVLMSASLSAKRALDHNDLDGWRSVSNKAISRDGRWTAYIESPQAGDGTLTFSNTSNGEKIVIERGYKPSFTSDGQWGLALIKPLYADTRSARIEKKKGFDMPQDSLAVIDLKTGRIERIASVINYAVGEKGGNWIAYQSCDTLHIKPKELKNDKLGRPLVIRDLQSPSSRIVKWVKDYTVSKDGRRIAFSLATPESDSLYTSGIGYVNLPDTSLILIDRDRKYYGAPVLDEAGEQLAYIASDDTTKLGIGGTRRSILYYADLKASKGDIPEPLALSPEFPQRPPLNLMPVRESGDAYKDSCMRAQREEAIRNSMGEIMRLNQYSKPVFSHNGRRLIAGVAPIIAPDDTTIVDFEHPSLDIWRWDSPTTPPQEKVSAKKDRERTYPVVFDIDNNFSYQLLNRRPLAKVTAPDRWDADWALVADPTENYRARQWDYQIPMQLSVVNVLTGETHPVAEVSEDNFELSPSGRFVIYFIGKNYYCYDTRTHKAVEISSGIPYPLWDTDIDRPGAKEPYGYAAWTEDDASVLIYDKYDIWSVDPTGGKSPQCLTKGDGRHANRQYRYRKCDPEQRFVKHGETMVLNVHDFTDKYNGYATLKCGTPATPVIKVLNGYSYTSLRKAQDADVFVWQRGNFETIPELWLARSYDFAKARCLTDINAQKSDISWGTAELVRWVA